MNYKIYKNSDDLSIKNKSRVVNFLHDHLDEYGDDWEYIKNAVDYAIDNEPGNGGFVLISEENDEITGAVVMNETGMKGYVPENILVYIAVHKRKRGIGLGKELMKRSADHAEGDIALHVEKDNPARFLYEKLGFINPYLEMRYYKSS